ncbi:hypothetical protein HY285_00830 [Candidatus Peregrinibacteria bacterium]|nr:hypothetical protein [Candidatus Peregrinibacteria bacterium]MBI3816074.1 hypothetical protein [Candidatus Peregrinibacteria bacterium]
MENCEYIDNGTGRPLIKTRAKGTKVVGAKFSVSKIVEVTKQHPWKAVITVFLIPLAIVLIGLFVEYTFFKSKDGNLNLVKVIDSPDSVNIAGNNNTVNKLDLPKAQVELKSFEINTPNPEIGFDSVYLLEVISDYTIANLPIKIRLPQSIVGDMWIYQDIQGARVGDFSPISQQAGYAFFNIANAQGEYHLVFGSKEPEQLTKADVILN